LAGAALIAVGLLTAPEPGAKDKTSLGKNPQAAKIEKNLPQFLKAEKSFTALLTDLKTKKVSVLAFTEDGLVLVQLKDGGKYYVNRPAPVQLLTPALEASGTPPELLTLNVSSRPSPPGPGMAVQFLIFLGQIWPLVALALVVYLVYTALPSRNKKHTLAINNTGVTFNDVIGASEAKEALQEIVGYLKHPATYQEIGARSPKGVLLEGPAGTGKTLLAKAVAGECGVPFFSISGADFTSPIVGIGVGHVKRLFADAKKVAPCVVFIDEIDSLGNRENFSFGGAAEAENRKILNTILTQLDGFGPSSGVIVLAATNHGQSLDKALVREGRFDRRCQLGLPTVKEREAILSHYAKSLKKEEGLDFSGLARRSAGMTPAALAAVVNKAGLHAIRRGASEASQKDFDEALSEAQLGSPSLDVQRLMSQGTKERTALHEAGHALVAALREVGVVEGATIVPRSRALGVTLLTPKEGEEHLLTEQDLRHRIQVLHAGRCAELLVYKNLSSGAKDDLEKASGLALAMVSQLGMSTSKYAPFNFDALGPQGKALALEKTIESAAALLKEEEENTLNLLEANFVKLKALAGALLDKETLSKAEIQQLLGAEA
jgi:cell division protease FtsH